MLAMKTAIFHGIDRRTIVMAMTGNNEPPLVKGPERAQGAFVPYSFPA